MIQKFSRKIKVEIITAQISQRQENREVDGKYVLTVKDNGVGFPADFDFHKVKSLGMQLVKDFVKQMNGKIELYNDYGTEVRIKL